MDLDEESLLSSPDPIAISGSGRLNTTIRPMRAHSVTPKTPLRTSNDKIRLQDFYLTTPPADVLRSSSPIKSIAQTENLISPWRIRVTVEAEKDERQGTQTPSKSPGKRLTEKNITTTVPLKGTNNSSSTPAKRGRGRPRKSVVTPIKKISTPGPKKSVGRRSGPVIVNTNAESALENATQPKKPRGRPRKSVGLENGAQNIMNGAERGVQSDHGTTLAGQPRTPSVSIKQKKGLRESRDRYKEGHHFDRTVHFEALHEMEQKSVLTDKPEADTPLQPISSPQQLKWSDERSTRPQTKSDSKLISIAPETMNGDATELTHGSDAIRQHLIRGLEDSTRLPGSHTGKNGDNSLQDPTELHHEFDSILESEGFSMVSVSTLPSAQLHLSSVPEVQEQGTAAQPNHGSTQTQKLDIPDTKIVEEVKEYITTQSRSVLPNSMFEETINTSLLDFTPSPPSASHGSSQLHQIVQQRTPSQMFSSPSLPPPLQPAATSQLSRILDTPGVGTSKTSRAPVRAGKALQGILGPVRSGATEPSTRSIISMTKSKTRSIKSGQDDIFSGFGAGTKRELRAGLRLGEELARRRHIAAEAAAAASKTGDDVFQEHSAYNRLKSSSPKRKQYALNIHCVERAVEYPTLPNRQLPTPEISDPDEEDDRMSWKADTPANRRFEDGTVLKAWTSQDGIERGPDRSRLAREAEWQLEREAVSRQIQQANKSQVIVIDSSIMESSEDGTEDEGRREKAAAEEQEDDEDLKEEMAGADDGETVDIWQSEAQQSSRLEQSASCEAPEVLFPDEVVKPRRSKLPSPWRRNSKLVYSDETEPVSEAVVRLPDLKHAVTPQESQRRKRSRLDVPNFSILSEAAVEPDDESTMLLGNGTFSSKTVEEETPVKGAKVYQRLSHAEYYAKMEEEIDDTWTLSATNVGEEDSPSSDLGPATAAMKAEPWENVSISQEPARTATSWLSRVTSYVPLWPFVAPKAQAELSLSTVNSNSPAYSPRSPPASDVLSIYLPWTNMHYGSLRRFYLVAKRDKSLYKFNPQSSSSHLDGQEMCSMGWRKPVGKWELGVIDAFLDHLDTVGVDDDGFAEDGSERLLIDELEVARRLFSLWVGEVQRQEAPVGNGTVGMFDVRHQWRKPAVLKAAAERI